MATFTRRAAVLALGSATAVIAGFAGPIATASAALSAPTSLAPDTPGAPLSPANLQKDPVLSWTAVTGAAGYQVELSHSDDWTDTTSMVALPNSGQVPVPSLAVPQPLAHGYYFWRVRATTSSTVSGWSAEAEFYRGWDAAPTRTTTLVRNDATVPAASNVDAPWRLSWTALPDASSYEIELSNSPTFPQPTDSTNAPTGTVDCLTTHTTWTPYTSEFAKDKGVDDCSIDYSAVSDSSGTTYWRVRGIDDSDDSFNDADAAKLLCFGATSAAAGSLNGETTQIALGTPTSTSQECSEWSDTGTVQFPVFGDGDVDRTALTDVGAVSLSCTSPCTDMPEISWQPVAHADRYRVTIAEDANGQTIDRTYLSHFLTLTPRDQLPDYHAGTGYTVFVQACTSASGTSEVAGCGPALTNTFTKVTPAPSGLSYTIVQNGVRFVWSDLMSHYSSALSAAGAPAVEAKNYIVQISKPDDTDFSSPVVTATVDRSCDLANVAGCYQPGAVSPATSGAGKAEYTTALAEGDYIWRVVPVDVGGNHLHGSSVQFVDTKAPTMHLTDATTGHGLTRPFHIKASEPVNGVSGSTVTIRPVIGGGGAIAGALSRTGSTTWTFTPSRRLVTGQFYRLAVSGVSDDAGNAASVTGSPVRTVHTADDTSIGWRYSTGWKKVAASGALGGSYHRGSAGSSAHVQLVGRTLSIYACKAPHSGRLRVRIDGTTVAAPSLAQSFTKCGVLVYRANVSTNRVHTLTVIASGGPVDLDRATIS